MSNSSEDQKAMEATKTIMAKLAAMPHKPHIDKSPADRKKKSESSPAKKCPRSKKS
ncbi:MAG: hypothetical protein KDK89_00715 [Alphaproteobacteria bacterium]|nr:hypothetical protein [Alphaproteobacteria bacterium]